MTLRRSGVGLSAALTLLLAAGAVAATSPVVPASGKVAGKGYAYFLKRLWLANFAASTPPPNCGTLSVAGKKVSVIHGSATPGATVTCPVPAGRPIYVAQLSNECSTIKGDHHGYGTASADLVKCSRAGLTGATNTASLDGRAIDLHALLSETGAFFVPKVVGPPGTPHTAHSAAYGIGILISGLSKGTHALHAKANIPGVEKANYTIKIRVT